MPKSLCKICGKNDILVVIPASKHNRSGRYALDRDGLCPSCARRMCTKMGEYITVARQEKRLTQHQLCEKSGVSCSALSNIEACLKNPSLSTVLHLADALNISVDALIGHEVKKEE